MDDIFGFVYSGEIEKVKEYIKEGGDLNIRYRRGDFYERSSLLHFACAGGNEDVVKLLIENKAKINAANHYGTRPLHRAACCGKLGAAKLLLSFGAYVDPKQRNGQTPLFHARDIDMVELLLDHGADINEESEDGSLFFCACKDGDSEKALILLKRGADTESVRSFPIGRMGYVRALGSKEIMTILEEQNKIGRNERKE